MTRVRVFLAAVAIVFAIAGPASASDAPLLALRSSTAILAQLGSRLSTTNDGQSAQTTWNAARRLQTQIQLAGPPSAGCLPLANAESRIVETSMALSDAIDRAKPALVARADGLVRAAIAGGIPTCTPGPALPAPHVAALAEPQPGDAFFGHIAANAPSGSAWARIRIFGFEATVPITRGRLDTTIRGFPVGQEAVAVDYLDSSRSATVGSVITPGVWGLPKSASYPPARLQFSPALTASLARARRSVPGYSAALSADLATGATGGSNVDALFPAASTVKLGLLVATLDRWGTSLTTPVALDVSNLCGESSNLATNRLITILGNGNDTVGAALAQQRLRQLGAPSSTFPGGYIPGTAWTPPATTEPVLADQIVPRFGVHRGRSVALIAGSNIFPIPYEATNPPPSPGGRVTSARDLATVLYTVLNSARSGTGLEGRVARRTLGCLLSADGVGDNIGLFRPSTGDLVPMAQKNGWLSNAFHTAAIAFELDGPRIVVALTDDVTRPQATAFGATVMAAAAGS